MENSLRRTLSISGGDFTILFQSPIAIGLYIVTFTVLAGSFVMVFRDRRGPSVDPTLPPVGKP